MLHTIRTAAFATASAAIALGAVSFTAQAKEASAVAAGFGQSGQAAAEETTTPAQQTADVVTGGFDSDASTETVLVDLTFTLINASVVDIHYVFVSPETSDNWGDDQLGQHILPAGYEIDLPVIAELDECFYDIQVVSSYGETLEFWGVDLCEVTEVEVY